MTSATAGFAQTETETETHGTGGGEGQGATQEAPLDPFVRGASEGLEHHRAGRLTEALAAFDEALRHPASDADRASVEFNAGACLFGLHRYEDARARFMRSAELDSNNAVVARINAGLAAVSAGQIDVAEAELAAVTPRTDEERQSHERLRAEIARARRAAADADPAPTPLPASADSPSDAEPPPRLPKAGLHGWLTVGGGYDSNAAQSGVGEAVGATETTSTESGFLTAMGTVHGTHRWSKRHAGRLYYLGDWLGLLATNAREDSLQGHTLGLQHYATLGARGLLRLGGGGGVALSGLEAMEVMTWEGFGDVRLEWDARGPLLTRVDVRVVGTKGAEDWPYLTGVSVDARLTERWEWDAWELGLSLGGRHNGIGSRRLTLEDGDLPACTTGGGQGPGPGGGTGTDCTGQTYVIPLAWSAPRLDLDLMTYPHERIGLGGGTGFEYRFYNEESYITGVRESRKLRQDLLWRAHAGAELSLDRASHLALLLDYRLLASVSNVAYDPEDGEHDLDYDDRTFTQHIVELGLLASF